MGCENKNIYPETLNAVSRYILFFIFNYFGDITIKGFTNSLQNVAVIANNLVLIIIINYLKTDSRSF